MTKEIEEQTLSEDLSSLLLKENLVSTYSALGSEDISEVQERSLLSIMENYLQFYAVGESHTARAKRYDLQHFIFFLAGSKDRVSAVKVKDWTLQSTKDFIEQRLSIGEAPSTVSRRLATIKHFGRTLAERIPAFINPAREAKPPVVQASRPAGLSAKEIEYLRKAAEQLVEESSDKFLLIRNRCLLELLLATGLRADEVRVLTLGQVSDDDNWLRNVKTKGKKFRNVYLETGIRPVLREYLNAREIILTQRFPRFRDLEETNKKRLPVFISLYQAKIESPQSLGLAPKTIWRVIAGLGVKAQQLADGQLGNLHPHKLRHTFAHGLLDSSKDVRLVAQALGHSDIRTTMRYTERSEQELAKAIEDKVRHKSGNQELS